ncbi:hypothetical protein GCM10010424_11540 [Streptomyces lienomycini]
MAVAPEGAAAVGREPGEGGFVRDGAVATGTADKTTLASFDGDGDGWRRRHDPYGGAVAGPERARGTRPRAEKRP